MALTEIQWGQILALAWIDEGFRDTFEKNPFQALQDLKNDPDLGAGLFDELGLEDEPSLVDLERIVDYPVDFAGVPIDRLIRIRNGDEPLPMPDSYWYWGLASKKNPATHSGTNPDALTKMQWTQIYARIWEDERSDDPATKKNYKANFEKNPAKVVRDIAEESKQWPEPVNPINYAYNTTRLYIFDSKPDNWSDEQLEGIVMTGKVNEHPLVWMVSKCC